MAHCEYVGPSGRRCEEAPHSDSSFCFWHDRHAEKDGDDIKQQLEAKARNRESMEGYELSFANLENAYLMEADLSAANLSRVNLRDGHLFGINLKGARLFKANLEKANLKEGVLEGADLLGASLEDTDLERVSWGPRHVVRNHLEAQDLGAQEDPVGRDAKYLEAEEIYRNVRKNYSAAGSNDLAGEFFYLEMVVKRKQMPMFTFARFWSKLVDILCGYGEIPHRIIGSSSAYIAMNAIIYCVFGMAHNGQVYTFSLSAGVLEDLKVFGYALYYSVVTFTTLGYGDFTPVGFSRPFAALEAFNGAFMIALFILAFVKKMTR